VIGGLITSTFATLFALPTLYIRFAARRVAGVAEADDQV
jgi:Cu/Ag efflux pump CusA